MLTVAILGVSQNLSGAWIEVQNFCQLVSIFTLVVLQIKISALLVGEHVDIEAHPLARYGLFQTYSWILSKHRETADTGDKLKLCIEFEEGEYLLLGALFKIVGAHTLGFLFPGRVHLQDMRGANI